MMVEADGARVHCSTYRIHRPSGRSISVTKAFTRGSDVVSVLTLLERLAREISLLVWATWNTGCDD